MPFQCANCNFGYWRRVDELFELRKLGRPVTCPNCQMLQTIDWDELDDAIDFMTAMQELDDDLGPDSGWD